MVEHIDIPRLIYTISYYYPGINKDILSNMLWFLDKMFSDEPLSDWVIENGQASHPLLEPTVGDMISSGLIKVDNNFSQFYGESGIIARETIFSPTPYKELDGWTNRIRMVLKYLIFNDEKLSEIVQEYEDKDINSDIFIDEIVKEILTIIHTQKVVPS